MSRKKELPEVIIPMERRVVRNDKGVPFSKWKPADKFEHVMRTDYPLLSNACHREYVFHPEFLWRHDFAWPVERVAVEIDGFGFGHQAQQCQARDNEKQNAAILMDWYVLRFNSRQLGSYAGVSDAVAMTWGLICDIQASG